MVKVSVIIPVYNAAKYLERCINSLLSQTLASCEFIFVNDGSTDSSQTLLEQFQQEDTRIKIIQQENKGVSEARNAGLKVAIGTYIGFVDADDYVVHNYFEKLYQMAIANDLDIVVSGFTIETNNVQIKQPCLFETNRIFHKQEIQTQLIQIFLKEDTLNSACNKLYKNSLIQNFNVSFPKGIVLGEDGLFNLQAFNYSNAIRFIDFNGYVYMQNENSAVRDVINKDYFQLALQQFDYNYKDQFDIQLDSDLIERLTSIRFINIVISVMYLYCTSNYSFFQKRNYILAIMHNPKVQKSIKIYEKELIKNASKYQQFILYCIKVKSFVLLSMAIQYSNFRNK